MWSDTPQYILRERPESLPYAAVTVGEFLDGLRAKFRAVCALSDLKSAAEQGYIAQQGLAFLLEMDRREELVYFPSATVKEISTHALGLVAAGKEVVFFSTAAEQKKNGFPNFPLHKLKAGVKERRLAKPLWILGFFDERTEFTGIGTAHAMRHFVAQCKYHYRCVYAFGAVLTAADRGR